MLPRYNFSLPWTIVVVVVAAVAVAVAVIVVASSLQLVRFMSPRSRFISLGSKLPDSFDCPQTEIPKNSKPNPRNLPLNHQRNLRLPRQQPQQPPPGLHCDLLSDTLLVLASEPFWASLCFGFCCETSDPLHPRLDSVWSRLGLPPGRGLPPQPLQMDSALFTLAASTPATGKSLSRRRRSLSRSCHVSMRPRRGRSWKPEVVSWSWPSAVLGSCKPGFYVTRSRRCCLGCSEANPKRCFAARVMEPKTGSLLLGPLELLAHQLHLAHEVRGLPPFEGPTVGRLMLDLSLLRGS